MHTVKETRHLAARSSRHEAERVLHQHEPRRTVDENDRALRNGEIASSTFDEPAGADNPLFDNVIDPGRLGILGDAARQMGQETARILRLPCPWCARTPPPPTRSWVEAQVRRAPRRHACASMDTMPRRGTKPQTTSIDSPAGAGFIVERWRSTTRRRLTERGIMVVNTAASVRRRRWRGCCWPAPRSCLVLDQRDHGDWLGAAD